MRKWVSVRERLIGVKRVFRTPGYHYFIDLEGDISRAERGRQPLDAEPVKFMRLRMKKKPGYWHFLGEDGYVYRQPRTAE